MCVLYEQESGPAKDHQDITSDAVQELKIERPGGKSCSLLSFSFIYEPLKTEAALSMFSLFRKSTEH